MLYIAILLGISLIRVPIKSEAQNQNAFEPLSVPPKSAGTCDNNLRVRAEPHTGSGVRRVHLVMTAIEPTRRREITAFIRNGKPVMFSEMIFRSTSMLVSSDDLVLARFDSLGRVTGFHTHGTTQLPDSTPGKLDTAFLRRMSENAVTKSTRSALDQGSARKVERLVAWLEKRCPSKS